MTKWRIRLSFEAEADFARILTYTQDTFGGGQARLYQDILTDALESLTEGPDVLGSVERGDILPNLRSLHIARRGKSARHFIMYRAKDEPFIEVLRILHDAMNLAQHIPPEI
ncbi:type II toxin-antitoxin system RelE/ParE family toxin [Asticcacaulis sp. MM231]|uniref:type II toxin-antitoxin system RelE/ParE family toxin n=1 Tax=Asticcacaulis sp. MM231 TaxID=3157666 RepID=UPI0032D57401